MMLGSSGMLMVGLRWLSSVVKHRGTEGTEMETNAYAPTGEDDSGQVRRSGRPRLIGCVAIAAPLCSLLLLAIVVGTLSMQMYRETNPPKPLLQFGDCVEVIEGFFKGFRGKVFGAEFRASPADPMGHWRYGVRLDSGLEYIDESQLRELGEGELITVVDAYGRIRYGRVSELAE